MKQFLLRTTSSNQDYNPCSYAVVTLDDDTRNIFSQAKQQDSAVYEMYFWGPVVTFSFGNVGCGIRYYDSYDILDLLSEEESALFEDNGLVEMTQSVPISFLPERTECGQMVVGEDGFSFVCIPKHSDVHVTTQEIQYSAIQGVLLPGCADSVVM